MSVWDWAWGVFGLGSARKIGSRGGAGTFRFVLMNRFGIFFSKLCVGIGVKKSVCILVLAWGVWFGLARF